MAAVPPFVVPVLQAFGDAVRPSVILTLQTAISVGFLLPLLCCVLYLSSRRGVMWYIAMGELCFGIAVGSWGIYENTKPLFDPVGALTTAGNSGSITVNILSPWLVDIALFVRLIVVYPYNRSNPSRFFMVIAFPVVVKIVRLVAVALLAHSVLSAVHGNQASATVAVSEIGWSSWATVEWVLQTVDNAYASLLFMWKLRSGFRGSDVGRLSNGSGDSLGARLRTLFWIAATSFVFPVIFNIAQLIVRFTCNFYVAAYLASVNIYLSIIAIVFAVLWSTSDQLRDTRVAVAPRSGPSTGLVFRRHIQPGSSTALGGNWSDSEARAIQLDNVGASEHSKDTTEYPLSVHIDKHTESTVA